jgi:hypothetical protein
LIGVLTAFVLGGASGYAAGSALTRDPAARDLRANQDVDDLRRSLLALQGSVDALNRRLAEAAVSVPGFTREPEPREETPFDLAAMSDLVTRLERAAQAIQARSTGTLHIPDGRPQALPPKPEGEEATAELERRFQLWTHQQVLDAFGRPDLVEESNSELEWWYRCVPESDGDRWFVVYFCDGFVVTVDFATN